MTDRLFSAQLRYWRRRRGLSQLDLAVAADVSARHVGFLESGRSRPGAQMVVRLLTTLDVPLRHQDEALRAAGFPPAHGLREEDQISPAVEGALARMLAQQEPYPLIVLSPGYDVLRSNRAATAVFSQYVVCPERLAVAANTFDLVFAPDLARPFVVGWEPLARSMLSRLHREALLDDSDGPLRSLLERVVRYPGVPSDWREPDLSAPVSSTLELRLQRAGEAVGFLTTMTAFSAPQRVAVDELRIESYFPLDEQTGRTCARLACARRPYLPR